MTDRPRPSCCRNLSAAFDAVAGDAPVEPPEIAQNRENLFAEQVLNDRTQEFMERWGYDVVADRPVEGSDWEWEPVNCQEVPVEQEAEVEVAVEEVAAESEAAGQDAEGAAKEDDVDA